MSEKPQQPDRTAEKHALVASLGRLPVDLARSIAVREGAFHLLDDLVAAATAAGPRAAASYKPVEGVPFSEFAKHHIRGAVYDLLRHEGRQRTFRRAAEMAAHHAYVQVAPSREDAVNPRVDDEAACRRKLSGYASAKLSAITVALWLEAEKTEPDPEAAAALRPFVDAMRAEVALFRPSDQVLLRCVYEAGMTLEEAAREAGIAHPTAKVRHRKLLARLRESFEARGLGGSSRS